ncbi:MAG TPA: thioredoxin family protein [Bacteroidales bacterium]|nr:thioredoxin family protein [Bacteroidales bacterium]HRZ76691.1 thioredoxin family protein [Bacteroidales bacterium]
MKHLILYFAFFVSSLGLSAQQGYNVGDVAEDFRLPNIDGKLYSLADIPNAQGFIVIFTCNHCPYSIAYEDRIIALHRKYQAKGWPVVAINPNDSVVQPADSWSAMKVRAREKSFPFLYLLDERQEVFPRFGATRTPHVYVLQKQENGSLKVAYIGAIDDNHKDAGAVNEAFLSNALDALMAGKTPEPSFTRAIGCSIKVKQ